MGGERLHDPGGGAAAKGIDHDVLSVPSAAMTVACEMVGVPARQGGVLTSLWPGRLASVLAASLGRGRVNERHLMGAIRSEPEIR
jgi:hypothetical protein